MKLRVAGLLLSALFLVNASKADQLVVLPYFNMNGYVTSLRIVNPHDKPVQIQSPFVTGGFGTYPITIQPFATRVFANWPGEGGGIVLYQVPEILNAYVEILDDHGSVLRLEPLQAQRGSVQMQDLKVGDDQRAYLWVSAQGGASLVVQFYSDAAPIGAPQFVEVRARTEIMPAPEGSNRVLITPIVIGASDYMQAPYYTFVYHRRQSGRYELQTPIYPVEIP